MIMTKSIEIKNRISGFLSAFFSGKIYPVLMLIWMLAGYFLEKEPYFAFVNMMVVSFAFLTTRSIKPMIFFVLTFFYQMNIVHSPMDPVNSTYYLTGKRLALLLIGAAAFIICGIIYTVKNKFYTKDNFLKMPLFKPMLILSAGLLANGLMKSDYTVGNILWALALIVVYVVLFGMLWLGLKGEDAHEIADYFAYINLLISWMLLLQVAEIYISGELLTGGTVHRDAFTLGFGKTNAVGFVLASLIPMNFYGFMKNKSKVMPYFYLLTAFALLVATVTSTSRNAVLVGCAYFAFCVIFSMFAGDRKKIARVLLPILIIISGAIALAFFKEELVALVRHYIDRTDIGDGLNSASAGRIDIWRKCWQIFKENQLFGAGFYGEEMNFAQPMAEIIPHFAHNTLFQLLAGSGAVGLLCYGYYRIKTLKYLFHEPTAERVMLMVAASTVPLGSIFDNHLFDIYPGIYYTTALVIAVLLYEKQFNKKECEAVSTVEKAEDAPTADDEDTDEKFIANVSELLEESSEILNS